MPDDPVDASIPLDQRDPASLTRGERAILARRSTGVGGGAALARVRSTLPEGRKARRRFLADEAMVRAGAVIMDERAPVRDVLDASKLVLQVSGDLRPQVQVSVSSNVAFVDMTKRVDAADIETSSLPHVAPPEPETAE